MRGPVGSGKTAGLAARAAVLAKQGKQVLVLSFNITLPHYIRDMAARRCREIQAPIRAIHFTHFHGFCADAADMVGASRAASDTEGPAADRDISAAMSAYDAGDRRLHRYDAILVDEGQDFQLDWWNFLRRSVLKPDGEMLLVADTTQDLYKRSSWTDEKHMHDAGFSGLWTQLEGSYRLPPSLFPLLTQFANEFVDGEIDPPVVPTDKAQATLFSPDFIEPCALRWMNTETRSLAEGVSGEVLRLCRENPDLHPDDIVFLVERHEVGLAVAEQLERQGLGVTHVFTSWRFAPLAGACAREDAIRPPPAPRLEGQSSLTRT